MKLVRLLALFALLAAPLVGCGDDDGDPTVSGDTTTPVDDDGVGDDDGDDGDDEIPSFTIVATDYAFDVPELTGGTIELTLENEGEELHEAFIVSLDDDMDTEQLIADMGPVMQGGPLPDYFTAATGVSEIEAGESITSTITLPEGRYGLICTIPQGTTSWDDEEEGGDEGEPEAEADEAMEGETEGEGEEDEPPMHAELGMAEVVEVTEANDIDLPEADGRILIRDYDFDVSDVTADATTLSTVNQGEQFHHVGLFAWPEDIETEEQVEANFTQLMESDEGPPPEGVVEPDEAGWSAVFGPDMGGTFEVEFESGRWYTAICFISDREGGPPHAFAHDMFRHFQVE